MAGLQTFSSVAISKREYNEVGPGIVHRKCCEGGYSMSYSTSRAAAAATPPLANLPPPPKPAATSPTAPAVSASPLGAGAPASALPEEVTAAKGHEQHTETKSHVVVAQQPLADSNSLLVRVGRVVAEGTAALKRGAAHSTVPSCCGVCGAVLCDGVCQPCRGFTTAVAAPEQPAAPPRIQHYVLQAPTTTEAEATSAKPVLPTAPAVILCVDTSGSMGLKTQGGPTRLACMQQALRSQIDALQAQQPDCSAVLINFHSQVSNTHPVSHS